MAGLVISVVLCYGPSEGVGLILAVDRIIDTFRQQSMCG